MSASSIGAGVCGRGSTVQASAAGSGRGVAVVSRLLADMLAEGSLRRERSGVGFNSGARGHEKRQHKSAHAREGS